MKQKRSKRLAILKIATAVLLCFIAAPAVADTFSGSASVIDGDTIELQGQQIQLLGIDAPESDQTCWDAAGQSWQCGQKAARALSDKIGAATVSCEGTRRDRDKHLVAVCRAGGENLNAWLVAEGWALAYRSYSTAYVGAEEAARQVGKGLWVGAFEPPWVWRNKNKTKP